ncbi:MAG: MOSC domain-containing protein [Deltaproteobacteria bacterium]|nr:MOSC domain-containing protein [Deltaproteobacteria bacterium]
MARILSACVSSGKGAAKKPVPVITLIPNHGVEGDAHAGEWHRQISLLAQESHETMLRMGVEVKHGDFGENIVTEGIILKDLPVGTLLRLGESAVVRVTQIGKECHDRCAIYARVGDCVMPREGVFVEVIHGGTVKPNDEIERAEP